MKAANQRRSSRSASPSPTAAPMAISLCQQPGFEPLDLRQDSRLGGLGAVQALARVIEHVRLGALIGGEGLVIGTRHHAGLVSLAPFQFELDHLIIEVEIEVAHAARLR